MPNFNSLCAPTDHGFKQCLMLGAHLVKLVNAAAALVCQHQGPSFQGIVPTTLTVLTKGHLHTMAYHVGYRCKLQLYSWNVNDLILQQDEWLFVMHWYQRKPVTYRLKSRIKCWGVSSDQEGHCGGFCAFFVHQVNRRQSKEYKYHASFKWLWPVPPKTHSETWSGGCVTTHIHTPGGYPCHSLQHLYIHTYGIKKIL